MSDYLTADESCQYSRSIPNAIPGAVVFRRRLDHWLIDVEFPNGQKATIDGETGDIEGDIEDLKALAEGREP